MDSNLTAKTGIDMSGESGSIWWSQNTFYDPENLSQLAAASFGQTFTITPLQLITAVSACVNGGYLMKPYVVKSIVNSDEEAVVSNSPTVVRQVVSEQTSATVRQILEQVVGDPVDGTGKNAYVAGYRIGGKTGTSERSRRTRPAARRSTSSRSSALRRRMTRRSSSSCCSTRRATAPASISAAARWPRPSSANDGGYPAVPRRGAVVLRDGKDTYWIRPYRT